MDRIKVLQYFSLAILTIVCLWLYLARTIIYYRATDEFGLEIYFRHVKILGQNIPFDTYELFDQIANIFIMGLPFALMIVTFVIIVNQILKKEKKFSHTTPSLVGIGFVLALYSLFMYKSTFFWIDSQETVFSQSQLYGKALVNLFYSSFGAILLGGATLSVLLLTLRGYSNERRIRVLPVYVMGMIFALAFLYQRYYSLSTYSDCDGLPVKIAMYNITNRQCEIGLAGCAIPEPWYMVQGCSEPCEGPGCGLLNSKYNPLF